MSENPKYPKSPLILLSIIGFLIISTLVIASTYFLGPNIESKLEKQLYSQFSKAGLRNTSINISGRDVTLKGFVKSAAEVTKAENTAKGVWGIRDVNNQLLVKDQPIE